MKSETIVVRRRVPRARSGSSSNAKVHVTLYRLKAGPVGPERDLESVRFAVYAGPLCFFDVVEVHAGPVADQVAKELHSLMPEIAEAAMLGDEVALALIGDEARERALVALNPQHGTTQS